MSDQRKDLHNLRMSLVRAALNQLFESFSARPAILGAMFGIALAERHRREIIAGDASYAAAFLKFASQAYERAASEIVVDNVRIKKDDLRKGI
jgi:hypothetical protein